MNKVKKSRFKLSTLLLTLALIAGFCWYIDHYHLKPFRENYVRIDYIVDGFNSEFARKSEGVLDPLTISDVRSAMEKLSTTIPIDGNSIEYVLRKSRIVVDWRSGPLEENRFVDGYSSQSKTAKKLFYFDEVPPLLIIWGQFYIGDPSTPQEIKFGIRAYKDPNERPWPEPRPERAHVDY